MKFLLILLLTLSAQTADWRTNQVFYWMANTPNVAITTTAIHGMYHATGAITTGVIGDQTGPLASYCNGFNSHGTCAEQANCYFARDHVNYTYDPYIHVSCRLLTNGITPIAANIIVGTPVSWFSSVRREWYPGTVTVTYTNGPTSFGDGMTVKNGVAWFNGTRAIPGDSGSPVFTSSGDFIGSVRAYIDPDLTVVEWFHPVDGVVVSPHPSAAGWKGIFE